MRPILLTHESPPFHGGAAIYCHELAQAAWRLQKPIEVWSPHNYSPSYPQKKLETGGTLHPWDIARFAQAVLKRRDELVGRSVILGSYGALLAIALLTPTVFFEQVRWFALVNGSEIPRFNRFWLRPLARKLYASMKHSFVISHFTEDLLLKSSFFLPHYARTLTYGAPCSAAAQEVDVPVRTDERFRLLTLARIHPRKGQLNVVEGLAHLPADLKSKLVYQIGGRGDEKYLQQVCAAGRDHGIAVEVLGSIADDALARCYAQCDAFIMTSPQLPLSVEGLGLTYLEAAWHGKPCIAYNHSGAPDVVLHEQTGFLVSQNEPAQIARAVEKLMTQPTLRNNLSLKAKAFAQSFNWEKIACQVLDQCENK